VLEPSVEAASRLLAAEVEEQLGRGGEERGVSLQDRVVDDVPRDHRLAESLGGDEDDVVAAVDEVELEGGFDVGAVDLRGPVPVEVRHGSEGAEAASGQAPLEAAAGALLRLEMSHVLEELAGAEALLGRVGDDVVEVLGAVVEAEALERSRERLSHGYLPGFRRRRRLGRAGHTSRGRVGVCGPSPANSGTSRARGRCPPRAAS